MKQDKNGFTLVELIIVISIMTILLGLLIPSLNSLFGFEAQKATDRIKVALSKTKVEAMNRLVGEMKLEYREDGYYITYYLDRGKESRTGTSLPSEEVKIASSKVNISYKVSGDMVEKEMKDTATDSLILTYNRENGAFRNIQTAIVTPNEVQEAVNRNQNISFHDSAVYCEWIKIQCGLRTRTIVLQRENGSYTIETN